MPITVQHQPPFSVVGRSAYQVGRGMRRTREEQLRQQEEARRESLEMERERVELARRAQQDANRRFLESQAFSAEQAGLSREHQEAMARLQQELGLDAATQEAQLNQQMKDQDLDRAIRASEIQYEVGEKRKLDKFRASHEAVDQQDWLTDEEKQDQHQILEAEEHDLHAEAWERTRSKTPDIETQMRNRVKVDEATGDTYILQPDGEIDLKPKKAESAKQPTMTAKDFGALYQSVAESLTQVDADTGVKTPPKPEEVRSRVKEVMDAYREMNAAEPAAEGDAGAEAAAPQASDEQVNAAYDALRKTAITRAYTYYTEKNTGAGRPTITFRSGLSSEHRAMLERFQLYATKRGWTVYVRPKDGETDLIAPEGSEKPKAEAYAAAEDFFKEFLREDVARQAESGTGNLDWGKVPAAQRPAVRAELERLVAEMDAAEKAQDAQAYRQARAALEDFVSQNFPST